MLSNRRWVGEWMNEWSDSNDNKYMCVHRCVLKVIVATSSEVCFFHVRAIANNIRFAIRTIALLVSLLHINIYFFTSSFSVVHLFSLFSSSSSDSVSFFIANNLSYLYASLVFIFFREKKNCQRLYGNFFFFNLKITF